MQRRVGAQLLEDLLEVVGADGLRAERTVLVGERGHLGQPDVVDLLRAATGGGEVAERALVGVGTALQPVQAAVLVGPRVREHDVTEHVAVVRHPGPHRPLDHRPHACAPGVDVDPVGRVQRLEQRVAVQVAGERRVELVDRVADREGGRGAAGLDALAVPDGEVAVVLPDALERAGHRLGHLRGRQPEHAEDQRHRGLDPEDRVGTELGQPGLEQVGVRGRVGDQHGAGDLLLLVEGRRVECLGAGGEVSLGRDHPVLRRPGHVLERTLLGVEAEQVLLGRAGGEVRRPVLVGQRLDRVGHPCSLSVSPSCFADRSRISTLRIFPVTVIGKSSTTIT